MLKKGILSVITIVLTMFVLCPSVLWANVDDFTPNEEQMVTTDTDTPPEDYVEERVDASEADRPRARAVSNAPRFLLVQDVLPWRSDANRVVLNNMQYDYTVIGTADFLTIDLTQYDIVAMANDQPFQSYENYKSFKEQMEAFAELGGVIVFGACDGGWEGGQLTEDLPGGIKKLDVKDNYNVVTNANHPIVTGELTDNQVLTDVDLDSNYCNHVAFDAATFPAGTQVILETKDAGLPTLIEYPLGKGRVIASGLTWEHNYVHSYRGQFAQKSLDDLFAYAVRVTETYHLVDITVEEGGTLVQGVTGLYAEGEKLPVEVKANLGYEFAGWVSSNGGVFENSGSEMTVFEVPGNAVMLTARFRPKTYHYIDENNNVLDVLPDYIQGSGEEYAVCVDGHISEFQSVMLGDRVLEVNVDYVVTEIEHGIKLVLKAHVFEQDQSVAAQRMRGLIEVGNLDLQTTFVVSSVVEPVSIKDAKSASSSSTESTPSDTSLSGASSSVSSTNTSGNETTANPSGVPKTGDTFNVLFLLPIATLSVVAILIIAKKLKENKIEE